MSLEMTHDDVRAALAAEALDALDGEEAQAVRAHLEGCEECRRELAALRESAALLAHAAPHRPMEPARSDRLRARLLARARADREASTGAAPGAVSPMAAPVADERTEPDVIPLARAREARAHHPGAGWLAAAASILLLLAVGAYALSLRGRYEAERERAASLQAEREELARALGERDATIAELSNPSVRVIDLASTRQQAPSGRMYWDPRTDRWTFFAQNLPRLRPGRDYQLWLITPAGPIGAGTFKPARDGRAAVQATYRLPPGQLRAVAVTEEPEGGLPQPSGTPIIVGTTE
jgi:anti-sigma-K factor RskA